MLSKEDDVKKAKVYVLLALVWGLYKFPYIGYVFLGVMLCAGIGAFVSPISSLSIVILSFGWKIYLVAAAVTLFVMTTFEFQHCCVGVGTFIGHIRHAGWGRHLEVFGVAVLWPVMWVKVDQTMSSWGLPWFAIVIDVLYYWSISSWRGTWVEVWLFNKEQSDQ